MRADAADEQRVAIHQQMLRSDRRGDARARGAHEFGRGAVVTCSKTMRRLRERSTSRRQHAVDEARLAIEHIDVRVGDLAVNLQDEAELAHASQHRLELADVGDAGVGVRGGAGRVEFEAVDQAAGLRALDFRRGGAVGQVQRHQRLELHARRQRRQDALAVGERQLRRRDRRFQIRHHDGACETRRGEGQDGAQRLAVAQMQVPVIGTS